MKYLFIALTVFIPLTVSAYTDLGTWGEQYEVSEKIEWKDENTSVITKEKMEKAINKAMISKEVLPDCKVTKDRELDPTVTLKEDINIPKYNIHIKKGTKFNPLQYREAKRYFVLINGSDSNQTALAEHYKNVSDIIIYNGSVNVITDSVGAHVYIANKSFTNSFKPQCLPSIYIQQKDKFLIKEISIKELLEEGGKNNE